LTFSRTSNKTSLNQETREVFAFPQLHNLQEMSSSQNNHNDVVTQVYKQIFSRSITNLPFTQLEHERCKTQDETTLNKRSGDVSSSSQQFDTCLLITKVVTDEKKRNVNELVADLPLSQHECERCEIQEGHIVNEQNKDISHSQSNTSILDNGIVIQENKNNNMISDTDVLLSSQHECERLEVQEGNNVNEQSRDISHSQPSTSTGSL
jgi:hypothetical protein